MQALNIRESGRLAFAAGIKVRDCPFAIRSQARWWWLKGYQEAKQQAAFLRDHFVVIPVPSRK
jgi:hypothetical protein